MIYDREGPAWMNLYTLDFSQEDENIIADMRTVQEMIKKFHKMIDSEIDILGDSTRFLMGGFTSSCICKSYPKALGGLIMYSSTVGKNISTGLEQEYSPVLWTHGLDDYRHEESCNYSLDNKKRKFVHVQREGLGHAVDTVIQTETKVFLDA